MEGLHLVIAISDREKAERVIEIFRESNVFTTDVALGTGTAPTEILDYLYLSPNEKAVVFGVVTNGGLSPLLKNFKRKLYIDVPGKGIVVTVPLNSIGGKRSLEYILDGQTLEIQEKRLRAAAERDDKRSWFAAERDEKRLEFAAERDDKRSWVAAERDDKRLEFAAERDDKRLEFAAEREDGMSVKTDFELIFVIANEGYSDVIMEAARGAGAGGGTVLKAKGTGAEYSEKFFGFSIASEKEIHLLVTPAQGRNGIMKAIMENAGLSSEAQAIVFSLPVSNAIGLRVVD